MGVLLSVLVICLHVGLKCIFLKYVSYNSLRRTTCCLEVGLSYGSRSHI